MSLASLFIAVTLTSSVLTSPPLTQIMQNKARASVTNSIVTPLAAGPALHLARSADGNEEDCVLVSRAGVMQPHRLVCAD
jgi:hypothetical protein